MTTRRSPWTRLQEASLTGQLVLAVVLVPILTGVLWLTGGRNWKSAFTAGLISFAVSIVAITTRALRDRRAATLTPEAPNVWRPPV